LVPVFISVIKETETELYILAATFWLQKLN
jgi:hypothetical protein